jgi:hypothetical protein
MCSGNLEITLLLSHILSQRRINIPSISHIICVMGAVSIHYYVSQIPGFTTIPIFTEKYKEANVYEGLGELSVLSYLSRK